MRSTEEKDTDYDVYQIEGKHGRINIHVPKESNPAAAEKLHDVVANILIKDMQNNLNNTRETANV